MIGGNFRRLFPRTQVLKYSKLKNFKVFDFNEPKENEFVDVLNEDYKPEPKMEEPKRDFEKEIMDQYPNQTKEQVINTIYQKYIDAFSEKDFSTAKDCLNKILIFEPKNGDVLYLRGKCFLERADVVSAKNDFLEALNYLKFPDPRIYFNLGVIETTPQSQEENYLKAIEILEKEPNELLHKSYNNLAYLYLHLERFEEGLEMIQKAIQLATEISFDINKELYIRARIYQQLGKYQESHQDYLKFISLNPKNQAALFFYSKCLISLKRYNEAIEIINDLIKNVNDKEVESFDKEAISNRKTTLSEFYYWKGICLLEIESLTEAKEALIESIKNYSKNVFSLKKLGLCHHLLKEFDDAVFSYSQAINYHFNDYETFLLRSESYSEMKNYKEAIFDQEMGLSQVDKKAVNVKFNILLNLLDLYQKTENKEKVIEYSNKILLVDSKNSAALVAKGFLHYKNQEFDLALKELQQVEKEEETVSYIRGILYFKKGNFEQSVKEFEVCVKLNPSKRNLHSLAKAEWKKGNKISSIKHFLNY